MITTRSVQKADPDLSEASFRALRSDFRFYNVYGRRIDCLPMRRWKERRTKKDGTAGRRGNK